MFHPHSMRWLLGDQLKPPLWLIPFYFLGTWRLRYSMRFNIVKDSFFPFKWLSYRRLHGSIGKVIKEGWGRDPEKGGETNKDLRRTLWNVVDAVALWFMRDFSVRKPKISLAGDASPVERSSMRWSWKIGQRVDGKNWFENCFNSSELRPFWQKHSCVIKKL